MNKANNMRNNFWHRCTVGKLNKYRPQQACELLSDCLTRMGYDTSIDSHGLRIKVDRGPHPSAYIVVDDCIVTFYIAITKTEIDLREPDSINQINAILCSEGLLLNNHKLLDTLINRSGFKVQRWLTEDIAELCIDHHIFVLKIEKSTLAVYAYCNDYSYHNGPIYETRLYIGDPRLEDRLSSIFADPNGTMARSTSIMVR